MDPVICSADNFFMVKGEYKFDPNKLGQAHGACLKDFIANCQDPVAAPAKVLILRGIPGCGKSTYARKHFAHIVVDNTNTTACEIAPYVAVAQAYGHEVEIVTLLVDPEVAAARGIHDVPAASVARMAARLAQENQNFPPWWNHTIMVPDGEGSWRKYE